MEGTTRLSRYVRSGPDRMSDTGSLDLSQLVSRYNSINLRDGGRSNPFITILPYVRTLLIFLMKT